MSDLRSVNLRTVISGLWCAAVAFAPVCASAAEFDFRGARVGMTIDEFKALAPLKPTGTTRCSTIRQITGSDSSPEAMAGVVLCSRDGDAPFPTDDFVKSGMTAVSYKFAPDEAQVLRLFRIDMRITTDSYPDALNAMTLKLGAPSASDSSQLQNGFGAKFTRETRIWQSASSTAILSSLCGSVDYGCIAYFYNSLNKAYEERLKAIKGSAADRF